MSPLSFFPISSTVLTDVKSSEIFCQKEVKNSLTNYKQLEGRDPVFLSFYLPLHRIGKKISRCSREIYVINKVRPKCFIRQQVFLAPICSALH